MWSLRVLSNQAAASESPGLACSPRQIWPPSAGLSSTMATWRPLRAAHVAAAMPAGPPPTTRTSKISLPVSIPAPLNIEDRREKIEDRGLRIDPSIFDLLSSTLFRANDHAFAARDLTAPAVCHSVDGHAAFKTNSHPAKRAARLAGDRPAERCGSRNQNGGRNGTALRHLHTGAVNEQGDDFRHAQAPSGALPEEKAQPELPVAAQATDPPAAAPKRARL